MAILRGWAPCDTRLTAKVPHGHWKTTTFLAALRYDRIEAPWVLDGPIDGESFAIYVEKVRREARRRAAFACQYAGALNLRVHTPSTGEITLACQMNSIGIL